MLKDLVTIRYMAEKLNRLPNTVKKQLIAKGIKPEEYAGPTGMYLRSAIEEIRIVPPVGHPKRIAEPELAAKPKRIPKK